MTRRRARSRRAFVPRLELLEGRDVPAFVVTVNDTRDLADADPGDGIVTTNEANKITLRAVFDELNAKPKKGRSALTGNADVTLGVGAGTITGNFVLNDAVHPNLHLRIHGQSATINGSMELNGNGHVIEDVDFRGDGKGHFSQPDNSLTFHGNDNTLQRCTFEGNAIPITINGGNNKVLGCTIVTSGDLRGSQTGILVSGFNNTIGGQLNTERNVITSAGAATANIFNSGVHIARQVFPTRGPIPGNNIVRNNLIGIDSLGRPGGFDIGLFIAGHENLVEGNTIAGNSKLSDVFINGHRNRIRDNNIGVTEDGNTTQASLFGVQIFAGDNNTIGGTGQNDRNVIAAVGPGSVAVAIHGGKGHLLENNLIGQGRNGISRFANDIGVLIDQATATVGGTVLAAANFISGLVSGVQVSETRDVLIQGNSIGMDQAGTIPMGGNVGVRIINSSDVQIGNAAGNRQRISSNGEGISITGGTGHKVLGNFIGFGGDGVTVANQPIGVTINASNCTVGGAAEGAHNFVAASLNGIQLFGNNNRVIGNNVGLAVDNSTVSGGKIGILVSGNNVTVGGLNEGEGNIVAGQESYGVVLNGNLNRMARNTIVQNFNGVFVNGLRTIIGGTMSAHRNVIIANTLEVDGKTSGIGIEIAQINHQGMVSVPSGIVVTGNLIGTDGTVAAPNIIGVSVQGNDNVVGDLGAGKGNVIYSTATGVLISSSSGKVKGTKIRGNLIGVKGDGKSLWHSNATPSQQDAGIRLQANPNPLTDTLIQGNVIGDSDAGILLFQAVPTAKMTNTKIIGNSIGISADGKFKLPNRDGIVLSDADNIRIGGATAAEGNLISANRHTGVRLANGANFNRIQRNFIGTNAALEDFGNGVHGVWIQKGAGNFIGTAKAAGGIDKNTENVIAFNGFTADIDGGERGHAIQIDEGTRNTVRGNSFRSNKGLSLFLHAGKQVLPRNDFISVDQDGKFVAPANFGSAGPNDLQNFPTAVQYETKTVWQLNSSANETFTLDFYEDNNVHDLGHGQGTDWQRTMTIATDRVGRGQVSIPRTISLSNPSPLITATVTDKDGNTSVFALVDQDGDSLADGWEKNGQGIDYDMNGTFDQPLPGANPLRKDIYIEADQMAGAIDLGQVSLQEVFTLVTEAFARAPDSAIDAKGVETGVYNPAGSGIALHINPDLPRTAFAKKDVFDPIRTDFAAARALHFGDDLNETQKAARAMAFRYAIFGHDFKDANQSGNGVGELGGFAYPDNSKAAITGGDDIFIALPPQAFNSIPGMGPVRTRDLAGAFMHELGHTLGLTHGGGDGIEKKPNYNSVMNYQWVYPNLSHRMGEADKDYTDSWPLDYSRRQLPDIDEGYLIERDTEIRGEQGKLVAVYTAEATNRNQPHDFLPLRNAVKPWQVIPQTGKDPKHNNQFIDWNLNGVLDRNPLRVDLNGDGKINKLTGAEDWSQLVFNFRDSVGYGSSFVGKLEIEPKLEARPAPVETYYAGAGDGAAVRVVMLGGPAGLLGGFFGGTFNSGVRVARGNLVGDERDDLVVATGLGGGTVEIYEDTGTELLLAQTLMPFGPTFSRGLNVAAGDINGDGRDDLIIGTASNGQGAETVRVLDGKNPNVVLLDFAKLNQRVAYTVASGDVDGDGRDEVIIGYGNNLIQVYSGEGRELRSFNASMNSVGVWLASADVDGDGKADIIVGAGEAISKNSRPIVRIFSGADPRNVLHSFLADDDTFKGGVRVTTLRLADGSYDIITGTGPGKRTVKRFKTSHMELVDEFEPFGAPFSGVFVG